MDLPAPADRVLLFGLLAFVLPVDHRFASRSKLRSESIWALRRRHRRCRSYWWKIGTEDVVCTSAAGARRLAVLCIHFWPAHCRLSRGRGDCASRIRVATGSASSGQISRTAGTVHFYFFVHRFGRRTGLARIRAAAIAKKHSPLIASLILAPLWALWHLPLMGNEFPWPIVPAFLFSLFGATFLLTWLF